MAKLDIRLNPEQHEALDASLKQFYVPTEDGKGFELEGIGSIQRALAEEKAKKTTKPELLTELEQLRQEKAERDAKAEKEAQDLLLKQGEFEKAQQARDAEWQKRVESAASEKESLFADVHRERLTNILVQKGVLPDRAEFLVDKLMPETELFKAEGGKYDLKKKGGIGDATEFDSVIEAAKQRTPFFFAASGASGSGASGSQQTSGNSNQIKRSQYDANPMQYAAALGKGEITVVPD